MQENFILYSFLYFSYFEITSLQWRPSSEITGYRLTKESACLIAGKSTRVRDETCVIGAPRCPPSSARYPRGHVQRCTRGASWRDGAIAKLCRVELTERHRRERHHNEESLTSEEGATSPSRAMTWRLLIVFLTLFPLYLTLRYRTLSCTASSMSLKVSRCLGWKWWTITSPLCARFRNLPIRMHDHFSLGRI